MANTIEIIIRSIDKTAAGFISAQKTLANVGKSFEKIGRNLTKYVTLPVVGLGAVAAKTAIDFESAFAGVIKTTSGLTDEMGNLTLVGEEMRKGFRDLAKEIPVSFESLTSIGELGGQLGIARENLLDFTKTVAAMGVATNLTAEEAAQGFAQIANIMGTAQKDIGRMGASIVELGNNFATTERDILNFSQRIAGAGAIAGLTEADIFAIGTAFASVGVEAEAGGTAVQKVLLSMTQAIQSGGDELEMFAKATGVSAQEFAQIWAADPMQAFTIFVENLGKQGDNAIATLEELGLTDQRLIRAFLSLAGAGDLLERTVESSTGAWEENLALTKEAEARYRTTASKIDIFKNTLRDVAATMGDVIVPILTDMLDSIKPMVESFANLDTETQKNIVRFALLAAAIGPAVTIAGKMFTVASTLGTVFGRLPVLINGASAAFTALKSGMSATVALGTAGLPAIAITLGSIAVAAGAVVAVWMQWNKQIVQTNREGQKAVKSAWEDFFQKQVQDGKTATEIANEYRTAQERVRKELDKANPIVRLFVQNKADLSNAVDSANSALVTAASSFDEYQKAAKIAGLGIEALSEDQYNQIRATMEQAEASIGAADSMNDMTGSAEDLAMQLEDVISQTESAAKAEDRLKQQLDDLQTIIAGALGNEIDDFNERQEDLQTLAEEARIEIAKLGGTEYLTPDQAEQIETLQSKLRGVVGKINEIDDTLKGSELNKKQKNVLKDDLEDLKREAYNLEKQIKDLGGAPYVTQKQRDQLEDARKRYDEIIDKIHEEKEAHAEKTKRILFDLIAERAAMLDLPFDQQFELLDELSRQWGLQDEATSTAMKNATSALLDFASGAGVQETLQKLGAIKLAALDTEGTYNINFQITTTGKYPTVPIPGQDEKRQHGGAVWPGGAFLVGERGPELFMPSTSGSIIPNQSLYSPKVYSDITPVSGNQIVNSNNENITNNFFNQGATALALAAQEEKRRARLKRSIGMRG